MKGSGTSSLLEKMKVAKGTSAFMVSYKGVGHDIWGLTDLALILIKWIKIMIKELLDMQTSK